MPRHSLELMARAQRDYTGAQTEAEREAALDRLAEAEAAHAKALGVQVGPVGWKSQVVPVIVAVSLAIVLALSIAISVSTNNLVDDVAALQERSVQAELETCARTNDARAAGVNEKVASAENLHSQLRFWRTALKAGGDEPVEPELAAAFTQMVVGLEREIANKERSAQASIDSQADVAIEPGSPIADCQRVVSPPEG